MRYLFLIAALLATTLAFGRVYKWVDADGNVHYTEQPPPDSQIQAEVVDTSASRQRESQRRDAARLQQQRQAQNSANIEAAENLVTEEAAKADPERKYQEQRKAACESAQANLKLMQNGRRVYEVDENGERQYVSDEERGERLNRYQGEVREYCS